MQDVAEHALRDKRMSTEIVGCVIVQCFIIVYLVQLALLVKMTH
jgi:hypothetical protein